LRKPDWRLVALAAGNFAHGSATMGLIGLLNEIADDLDVSIASAGQLVTGMQFTAAVAAPLIALFGGRFPRRTLLLFALGLLAACQTVATLAPSFGVLLAVRTVAGLSTASYAATVAALASALVVPERRGGALAFIYAGFALASIVGVPLGVWAGGVFGWRFAMAGFGVVALAALAWIALSVPPAPARAAVLERSAWAMLLGNRAMLALVLYNLAASTGQMMFFSYIAPLLRAALGADAASIGMVLGWQGIWALVGSLLGARLMDRLRPPRVIWLCAGGMLAGVLLWPLAAGSLAGVLALIALWGMSSVLVFTGIQAQLVHLDPRIANVSLAVLASTAFWGGVVGPAAGGAVIATIGLGAISWGTAAIWIAAAALLVTGTRAPRRGAHG
jgi:predicted MFS family arabinose efflux permease